MTTGLSTQTSSNTGITPEMIAAARLRQGSENMTDAEIARCLAFEHMNAGIPIRPVKPCGFCQVGRFGELQPPPPAETTFADTLIRRR